MLRIDISAQVFLAFMICTTIGGCRPGPDQIFTNDIKSHRGANAENYQNKWSQEEMARIKGAHADSNREMARAREYLTVNNREAAEACMRRAVAKAPRLNGHTPVQYSLPLARLLLRNGHAEEAATLLQDCSQVSEDGKLDLAIAHFETGNLQGAKDLFERSSLLGVGGMSVDDADLPMPTTDQELGACLYLARGIFFENTAEVTESRLDLEKSRNLQPSIPLTLYLLGRSYESEQGRHGAALECFRTAKLNAKGSTLSTLIDLRLKANQPR